MITRCRGYLLPQPLLDHWSPRHQAEPHAIIQHRVAPAGEHDPAPVDTCGPLPLGYRAMLQAGFGSDVINGLRTWKACIRHSIKAEFFSARQRHSSVVVMERPNRSICSRSTPRRARNMTSSLSWACTKAGSPRQVALTTLSSGLEEALRVFYVGITRARDNVHLMYSGFRQGRFGRTWREGPSQFMDGLLLQRYTEGGAQNEASALNV